MDYKVGIGYDIHRLVEGRKLVLGGLEIPYHLGLLGHSDGDALLHSICDALLGALALGDIGEHFPDSDPQYLNIASVELLKKVAILVAQKGFIIVNIDTVIIAQEPVLSPFKKDIQGMIAGVLKIDRTCVNVKAKTNEGLGEVGEKKAIQCYAISSLKQKGLER